MASGKTRVGREFARFLGWPFYDTDDLIEEKAGVTISEIFADQGETAFRTIETRVIKAIADKKNCVVALGGGAVLCDENWTFLNSGITICLAAPVQVLADRIARNHNRPLMAGLDKSERLEKIRRMLNERQPYYDHAQFCFKSSDHRSINDFVYHIYSTLLDSL